MAAISDAPRPVVRVSERARRISVRSRPDGEVEVVVPVGAPRRAVDDAIARAGPWIAAQAARRAATPDLGLGRPGVVWLHGAPLRVVRELGAARAAAGDGVLVLRAPDDAAATRALTRWYRGICRDFFSVSAPDEATRIGVPVPRIAIREARTRWGSCSPATRLVSLNWRLIVAPKAVARYVLVHELAHLRHPDHGRRFWDLVARHHPDLAEDRAWLREYGSQLLRYDVTDAIR